MKTPEEYYNALPKKRMGAGALFFNEQNQVLLVKPNYKPGWEIPGGVVEADESPRECCQREVLEEIGLQREIGPLLVVEYSHATGVKTESLMFVFDGGVLTAAEINAIKLQADELETVAFFGPNTLPDEMTDTLCNRVQAAWQQRQASSKGALYLENGTFGNSER